MNSFTVKIEQCTICDEYISNSKLSGSVIGGYCKEKKINLIWEEKPPLIPDECPRLEKNKPIKIFLAYDIGDN